MRNISISILCFVSICFGCITKTKDKKNIAAGENSSKMAETRWVVGNRLISKKDPTIEIEVSDNFQYVGSFEFEIQALTDEYSKEAKGKTIAAGDRFVFVDSDEKRAVKKMFIVQLEGFLDNNEFIYNYDLDNAPYIGDNKYRNNTWFYNSKKAALKNPNDEGALTRKFLIEKGYRIADEFMMSRFVGLASADRKKEIIIFYIEMLQDNTKLNLEEFQNNISEDEAARIEQSLIERSKKSFKIVSG